MCIEGRCNVCPCPVWKQGSRTVIIWSQSCQKSDRLWGMHSSALSLSPDLPLPSLFFSFYLILPKGHLFQWSSHWTPVCYTSRSAKDFLEDQTADYCNIGCPHWCVCLFLVKCVMTNADCTRGVCMSDFYTTPCSSDLLHK